VDLAQAAIGPGMGIYSKYKAVLEADGSPMTVHTALILINKAVDEYFSHVESDMDADTRFCVAWFQQYEFKAGAFGEADVLARAKGTSVDGVKNAGVVEAGSGQVRLLRVKEYPSDWDPTADGRTPVWEALHQMIRALNISEAVAGELLAKMPNKAEPIKQLAFRLYTLCERNGWAEDARDYNNLAISWHAIVEESRKAPSQRGQLGFGL
jgi:putative DNA methylase